MRPPSVGRALLPGLNPVAPGGAPRCTKAGAPRPGGACCGGGAAEEAACWGAAVGEPSAGAANGGAATPAVGGGVGRVACFALLSPSFLSKLSGYSASCTGSFEGGCSLLRFCLYRSHCYLASILTTDNNAPGKSLFQLMGLLIGIFSIEDV